MEDESVLDGESVLSERGTLEEPTKDPFKASPKGLPYT